MGEKDKKRKKEKKREEKREKGKKEGGKREEKKGIILKKGKYPYFILLFNMTANKVRKNREELKKKKKTYFSG